MQQINNETSSKLKSLDNAFSESLLEKHFELQPGLKAKYGNKQIHHYIEDTNYHLTYLAEAINNNEPILFNEYLGWAKTFFANLSVTDEDIILNLELLRDELKNHLSNEMFRITSDFINEGVTFYKKKSPILPSFITNNNPQNILAKNYLSYLIDGDKKSAHDIIMEAVENNISIKDLYLNVFQVTQKETGRLWQLHKISVAQEHFITAATQLIMAQLYQYLFNAENKNHKVIVSCVEGELHEIGARMVADIFEMEGWNSYYFGANNPITSLLKSIENYQPEIIAISVTMTFNLSLVSQMIENIKLEFDSDKMKILVGGYPFLLSDKLWRNLGADGFAPDALAAVELAEKFIN